jgi:hypothetical protein
VSGIIPGGPSSAKMSGTVTCAALGLSTKIGILSSIKLQTSSVEIASFSIGMQPVLKRDHLRTDRYILAAGTLEN